MNAYVCRTTPGPNTPGVSTINDRDGNPAVVFAGSPGEAKAQFKKLAGEKPQNRGTRGVRNKRTCKTKGTRRRLPVGYRVRLAGAAGR